MNPRIAYLSAAAAVLFLFAAPAASAVSITFRLEGHPPGMVMDLPPETNEPSANQSSIPGQMDVPIDVKADVKDFACVGTCSIQAEFNVDVFTPHFPLWAGASFNPGKVTCEDLRTGEPGTTPKILDCHQIILEIKWNLETRPNKDDKQLYQIQMTEGSAKITGNQVPPVAAADFHFTPFDIYFQMANRPPPTQSEICQIDPSDVSCQTTAAAPPKEGGNAPGIDFAMAGLVVAVSLALARRRFE